MKCVFHKKKISYFLTINQVATKHSNANPYYIIDWIIVNVVKTTKHVHRSWLQCELTQIKRSTWAFQRQSKMALDNYTQLSTTSSDKLLGQQSWPSNHQFAIVSENSLLIRLSWHTAHVVVSSIWAIHFAVSRDRGLLVRHLERKWKYIKIFKLEISRHKIVVCCVPTK